MTEKLPGEFDWYFLRIPPTRLYRRIFGANPSGTQHDLWTERETPNLEQMNLRSTEALRSGASGYEQEFKIARDDGKVLWVH